MRNSLQFTGMQGLGGRTSATNTLSNRERYSLQPDNGPQFHSQVLCSGIKRSEQATGVGGGGEERVISKRIAISAGGVRPKRDARFRERAACNSGRFIKEGSAGYLCVRKVQRLRR